MRKGFFAVFFMEKILYTLLMSQNFGTIKEQAISYLGRVLRGDSPLYDALAEAIRPRLSSKTNLLEFPCGAGLLAERLSPDVRLYEAADPSGVLIRRAEHAVQAENVRFSVQDLPALSFSDAYFDVVILRNFLRYSPHPQNALSEARRVLRDDGILIAPIFAEETGAGHLRRVVLVSLSGLKPAGTLKSDSIRALFSENGFAVTEMRILRRGSAHPICFVVAKKAEPAAPTVPVRVHV